MAARNAAVDAEITQLHANVAPSVTWERIDKAERKVHSKVRAGLAWLRVCAAARCYASAQSLVRVSSPPCVTSLSTLWIDAYSPRGHHTELTWTLLLSSARAAVGTARSPRCRTSSRTASCKML